VIRTPRSDQDLERRRRAAAARPARARRTHTFTCSADLLRAFEHRAFELNCSVDWLLEEAMQRLLADRLPGERVSAARSAQHSDQKENEDEPPTEKADLADDDDDTQVESGDAPTPAPSPHQLKALAGWLATPGPLPPPPDAGPATVRPPPKRGPSTVPPPPMRRPSTAPPSPARASAAAPPLVAPPPMRAQLQAPPPPPASVAPALPLPPPPPPPGRSRRAHSRKATPVSDALVLYYGDERLVIDHQPYVIGRSASAADLVIEDHEVSRRHAVIEHTPRGWVITDLGSTNGIVVDGETVRHAVLRAGAMMSIGSMAFRIASSGS
jgi:hypothetical protein